MESSMIKKILFACAISGMLITGVSASEPSIEVSKGRFSVGGVEYQAENYIFERHGEIYMQLDEVLSKCGYELGWNEAINGTVCESESGKNAVVLSGKETHIVGYKMYRYENPVIRIGDLCYVNEMLLEDITGMPVSAMEEIGALPGSEYGDDFRKNGRVLKYPDAYVVDREYIFDSQKISEENARNYAGIVNDFAKALPGVNVYNMLVPDSGEIYAPKQYYTGQLEAFQTVYEMLDGVTPVKISDTLYAHADEQIYFRTDHHWTQRGAYYAWKAFMDLKGEKVPSLSLFAKKDTNLFTGSFAANLEEYNAIDNKYETLERFMPMYDVNAYVYQDMYMKKWVANIELVNPDKDGYNCFIAGDCPLTMVSSSVRNGKTLAIIKESCGNVLSTWAVNNYDRIYIIDIRAFKDEEFDIKKFHEFTRFQDLLIESYPTTIESAGLRAGLLNLL